MAMLNCRFCGSPLADSVVDLGMSPLCESYLPPEQLDDMEPFYPLHVCVCDKCFLVQLDEYVSPEHIFTEYAYFSSFSTAWLKHAEDYVAMITTASALDAQEPRGRAGEQRRLPAAVLRQARHSRAWASSRRPTWPRRRASEGSTPW